VYRTSVFRLAETNANAEGVKDSILHFSRRDIRWGRRREVCLGLAAA